MVGLIPRRKTLSCGLYDTEPAPDQGCETALLLSRNGNDVTIVEMLDELMKNEEIKHNTAVLIKMLEDDGIEICLNTDVTEIDKKGVRIKDRTGASRELEADLIVIATGYSAQPDMVKHFMSSCKESYAVGDCASPGRIQPSLVSR